MGDLAKGMIRWWKHRVMDYEGDNEGQWTGLPYPSGCTYTDDAYKVYAASRKFVPFEHTDLPYAQEFTATMQLCGFYRGRSAAGFTFKDETGREHTMRIKCVTDLLLRATIAHGRVRAVWAYAKQGSNFSLKYLRDAE